MTLPKANGWIKGSVAVALAVAVFWAGYAYAELQDARADQADFKVQIEDLTKAVNENTAALREVRLLIRMNIQRER